MKHRAVSVVIEWFVRPYGQAETHGLPHAGFWIGDRPWIKSDFPAEIKMERVIPLHYLTIHSSGSTLLAR